MGNSTLSVLVLGASTNPSRYSYKAVLWLSDAGYKVVAVGKTKGQIGSVHIQNNIPESIDNLYAVSVYLNPENQTEYVNQILKLKPKRVVFNPLAENKPFEELLTKSAIEPIEACTLVMLKTGEF
jgi:uncharacterized protein